MAFYWKYTRSGKKSTTYISFIIDVLPSYIVRKYTNIYWNTSFEELESFLILLQDIEEINHPDIGITKQNFARFVAHLNYKPTASYVKSGAHLHLSSAVMGSHKGEPLPWGFVDNIITPICLNVTNLQNSFFLPNQDVKLSYFSAHSRFENSGEYWDYMPMHSCLIDIITAMKRTDANRTDNFVKNKLKWI
jgi:hypothetical protein